VDNHIKIGTRASKLALWQAYFIEEKLKKAGATTEIVKIETKGDQILDRALSKIGSKGLFTQELEDSLFNGTIDIAVHSAKDLPSSFDEGLEILAFSKREKANDVLVSNRKINLSENLTIGTSSTRRVALLRHYYPHLNIVDMRGNLQTRYQKMQNGTCDAMVLAFAGVHRMALDQSIQHVFDKEQFIPPVGQGCVAIQISKETISDHKKTLLRNTLNNSETEKELLAERSFLKKIEGGCSIPVFAHATYKENITSIRAGIISLDGNKLIEVDGSCLTSEEVKLGKTLAEELLEKGGYEILTQIKSQLNQS
jgi:hydroxymethylbilane synthase